MSVDDSSQEVIDDSIDEATGDASVGLFDSYADFKTSVIGIIVVWVVTNVFLDPAAYILGILDWVFASSFATIEFAIKNALGTVGGEIAAVFVGPTGIITTLEGVAVDLAASAGIGAPVAVELFNLLIFVLVVGTIYLLGRAAAGYLSGGVLS